MSDTHQILEKISILCVSFRIFHVLMCHACMVCTCKVAYEYQESIFPWGCPRTVLPQNNYGFLFYIASRMNITNLSSSVLF